MDKPKLYIMIGISGSGKSTIAERIKESEKNFEIFCLDKWKKEKDVRINFLLACKKIDFCLSKGKNIIFDATNLTEWHRQNFINNINTLCNITYIFVDTPVEESIKRDSLREEEEQVGANEIIKQYVLLEQDKKSFLNSQYRTIIIKN